MSDALIARDRWGNLHEIKAAELSVWRPSVYGIVIRNDQILLVSERDQHGTKCYALPGGGMDFGETFEQTVEREVNEETGLVVKALEHLSTRTNLFVWEPDDYKKRKTAQSILVYYKCEFVSGDISDAGYDEWEAAHMELAEWVALERLGSMHTLGSIDFREILKETGFIEGSF